jgi:hypothetical protein
MALIKRFFKAIGRIVAAPFMGYVWMARCKTLVSENDRRAKRISELAEQVSNLQESNNNRTADLQARNSRILFLANQVDRLKKLYGTMRDKGLAWIDVTEKLPTAPEHDWVLVKTKMVPEGYYGVPHIAELRNGVWYSTEYDTPLEETASVKVTHWMDIPDPEGKADIKSIDRLQSDLDALHGYALDLDAQCSDAMLAFEQMNQFCVAWRIATSAGICNVIEIIKSLPCYSRISMKDQERLVNAFKTIPTAFAPRTIQSMIPAATDPRPTEPVDTVVQA